MKCEEYRKIKWMKKWHFWVPTSGWSVHMGEVSSFSYGWVGYHFQSLLVLIFEKKWDITQLMYMSSLEMADTYFQMWVLVSKIHGTSWFLTHHSLSLISCKIGLPSRKITQLHQHSPIGGVSLTTSLTTFQYYYGKTLLTMSHRKKQRLR